MSDAGSRAGSAEPRHDAEDNHNGVEQGDDSVEAREQQTADQDDDEQLDEVEENHQGDEDNAEEGAQDGGNGGEMSENDSDILSEIDEDQFADDMDDRPVEIDEAALKSLKPAKRKAAGEAPKKKPKDSRRPRKRARSEDDDDLSEVDENLPDRRPRKARPGKEAKASRKATPDEDPEENLSPEERRKRALNRLMDEAIKGPSKRKRKVDDLEFEAQLDEEIATLKVAMEKACIADNQARNDGKPALAKLQLLPEVMRLLNRPQPVQDAVVDPETNFMQSVKYFLEPLDDGSLPAYNIQRDIFTALIKLPFTKDTLLSSGIGKVVLFYTKSKRAELSIKRMAERLVGEWSRPILKRTDDYKKKQIETRDFDYAAAKMQQRQEAVGGSQYTLSQRPANPRSRLEQERARLLAAEANPTRSRPPGLPTTYTVAPRSTYDSSSQGPDHRPIGAAGAEAFRKITQKNKGKR